jgi:GTPase SAR1 family protein
MQQYLRAIGRDCLVVNMDPANEIVSYPPPKDQDDLSPPQDSSIRTTEANLPYDVLLDVCHDVIHLNSVMEELNLGPNGGLIYCLEYMEQHMDVLLDLIRTRLDEYEQQKSPSRTMDNPGIATYVLFDFPGQVELVTHHTAIQHICQRLTHDGNFQLAAVQLIGTFRVRSTVLVGIVGMVTDVLSPLDLSTFH